MMAAEMKQRSLRLMADHDCFPLWERTGTGMDNVDPAALPISPSLQDALDLWAEQHDATLDRDDPGQSGFKARDAESAFKAEGKALLGRLEAELGGGFALTLQV